MRWMLLSWAAVGAVVVSGCGPSTPTTTQGAGLSVTPTQPTPPKGTKPIIE